MGSWEQLYYFQGFGEHEQNNFREQLFSGSLGDLGIIFREKDALTPGGLIDTGPCQLTVGIEKELNKRLRFRSDPRDSIMSMLCICAVCRNKYGSTNIRKYVKSFTALCYYFLQTVQIHDVLEDA